MRGPRMSRVNELIREVVADEVAVLTDPAIVFITVTGVDTSPDLANAIVYYSALAEPEEKDNTQAALDRAAPRVRSRLAAQVRLKKIPKLHFRRDESIERGLHMEQLLRDLENND